MYATKLTRDCVQGHGGRTRIDPSFSFAQMPEIFNPNPVVFSTSKASNRKTDLSAYSLWINDDSKSDNDADEAVEPIDQDEIFGENRFSFVFTSSSETYISSDLIRNIYDPEHPNTLEELRVVSATQITLATNHVKVEFTPTVPHCGMSTLIGIYFLPFLMSALNISS